MHTGGHVTEMRTFAQSVEAIAQRLGDVPLQIAAQCYLAAASHLSGDYRGTEHVCRKLMQSLHGQATHERFGLLVFPAVMARGHLARALAERGISDEETRTDKRRSGSPKRSITRSASSRDVSISRISRALGGTEPGRPSARTRSLSAASGTSRPTLRSPWLLWGTSTRGRDTLRRCLLSAAGLTAYERRGSGFYHSRSVEQLGEAYLLADQVENAGPAPTAP